MQYPPHIDVEPLFTDMVRNYPMGSVLTDIIPHPDFLNADFIFHHEKVVAELKRAEIDNSTSPNNQAKLNSLLNTFYSAGRIKTKELSQENWASLPKELQDGVYDITTHSIKAQIAKANKQIKETKLALGLNSYQGVLIIVNDGVHSFPPASFVHAAFRLIRKEFSGITAFIFFTVNVYALSREHPVPMLYWLSIDMEKQGILDKTFSNNLFNAWKGTIRHKTGIRSYDRDLNDMEGFWKAVNMKD